MKIEAAQRLIAYDTTWVPKMEKKTKIKYGNEPKPQMLKDEQIFKLAPAALAQRLKSLYGNDGFSSAMGALTAYKNRAGKTMVSQDKDRIEQAKEQLRKLYGKDKDQSKPKTTGPKPTNPSKPANDRTGRSKPVGTKPIGSRPSGRIV